MLLNCGVGEDSWESLGMQGDQSWVFTGGADVKAETPILWPADAENWLIWKDPGSRKDWRQEDKGMTENEMVGWHHWHNGHGFRWTPGVGGGQGGLVYCGSWGRKESDTTEWLNLTETLPVIKVFLKLRCFLFFCFFVCEGKALGSWRVNRISYPNKDLRISYAMEPQDW